MLNPSLATVHMIVSPRADPASKVRGGAISVIFGSQVSLRVHWCKSEVYFTHSIAVTKQWTAKWPYIANAVFRVVQNHGE